MAVQCDDLEASVSKGDAEHNRPETDSGTEHGRSSPRDLASREQTTQRLPSTQPYNSTLPHSRLMRLETGRNSLEPPQTTSSARDLMEVQGHFHTLSTREFQNAQT